MEDSETRARTTTAQPEKETISLREVSDECTALSFTNQSAETESELAGSGKQSREKVEGGNDNKDCADQNEPLAPCINLDTAEQSSGSDPPFNQQPVESIPSRKGAKSFKQRLRTFFRITGGTVLIVSMTLVLWAVHAVVQLSTQPYTRVPLKEMIAPALNGSDASKTTYIKCLGTMLIGGLVFETGRDENAPLYASGQVLDDLREHGLQDTPLYVAALGTCVALGPQQATQSVEQYAQQAIRQCSTIFGARHILVAGCKRELARHYYTSGGAPRLKQALELVNEAKLIDSEGGSGETLRLDAQLLALIFERQKLLDQADREWKQFIDYSDKVYGPRSNTHALSSLEFATYLVRTGRTAESIPYAKEAVNLLSSRNTSDIAHQFDSRRKYSFSELINPPIAYFRMASNSAANNAVRQSPTSRQAVNRDIAQLEDECLNWLGKVKPSLYFATTTKFAEEYQLRGDYVRADQLYKAALKRGFKAGQSVSSPSARASAQYLECMAKAASNCKKMGDVKQANLIALNCIKIMDPFNHWLLHDRFDSVLEELVLSFGDPGTNGVESRETVTALKSLLEKLPVEQSSLYLGELAELAGDLTLAEQYYRARVQLFPRAAAVYGTLAACLQKEHKFMESGQLFLQAEQLSRSGHEASLGIGTMMAEGRIKRLLDLIPDTTILRNQDWYCVLDSIKGCKTSAQLGARFDIIDLRPFISDYRPRANAGKPKGEGQEIVSGRVIRLSVARKELDALDEKSRAKAKQLFPWYKACFPAVGSRNWGAIARETLPSTRLPDMKSAPFAPAELIPDHFLVIEEKDAKQLEKMLGRKLNH